MPTLVEELSARAKALSTEDRVRLAKALLDSLRGDADADAAWACEIERRVAEVEFGAVNVILAEDVHAEARRLIREGKQNRCPPRVEPRLPLFKSEKPRLAEQIARVPKDSGET